jgi:hypothetical protein
MLGRIEPRTSRGDSLPIGLRGVVVLVGRNLLGQKGTRIDKERFQGP